MSTSSVLNKIKSIFKKALTAAPSEKGDSRSENSLVTVGGFQIEIPPNNPLGRHYEKFPLTHRFLVQLAKILHQKFPDLVAVDVGANVGDTLALMKTGADIPVICIEGDEFCASVLERNARLFRNVNVVKQYLGERREDVSVSIGKTGWNSTLIPDRPETGKNVTLTTLDLLLLAHPFLNNIRFVKVDCEGFDFRILRGGVRLISRQKPVLAFELNYYNLTAMHEDGKDFVRWLMKGGYDRFFIFESSGGFLFECSTDCWSALEGIIDYVQVEGNRLDYLEVIAFPSEMGSCANRFADELKSEIQKMPIAGTHGNL